MTQLTITSSIQPSENILALAEDFLRDFTPLESLNGAKVLLICDEKSKAYYSPCHLKSNDFCDKADFEATIDGSDEDEIYKLNRDITENELAYSTMAADAKAGRSFEDIVVEFDKTYTPDAPLKIYGGQHRIKAINAAKALKPNTYHGFRVYFGLTKEQKVEIATINNTSITVSNDLLDRMKEQLLGSELRDYCQSVGLLGAKQEFADKKDLTVPTVRVARTLVLNYCKGKNAMNAFFHVQIFCMRGGVDEDYNSMRSSIDWNDLDFLEAGKKFAHLHQTQRNKVTTRRTDNNSQFASKALSLAVVSAWSYAAGLYSSEKNSLLNLYNLTENLGQNDDPLNAKGLSEARIKGIDTDTYRGLGARISAEELGRMLEVFVITIEKGKKINKELANAAILSYHAKRAANDAQKSLSKLS